MYYKCLHCFFLLYFLFPLLTYGQTGKKTGAESFTSQREFIKHKSFENKYLNKNNKELEKYSKWSNSSDSWDLYNLSYAIDANNTMYKATGNLKYLDRSIFYAKNAIKSSVNSKFLQNSQYQDDYCSWVNKSNPSKGNDGKEYALYESFCWRYVTDILKIIYDYKLLNYQNYFHELLLFTETNIYDKWESRGIANLYRSNVHMRSHWAKIAMILYVITKKNKYKVFLDTFIKDFTNHLIYTKTSKGVEVVKWYVAWEQKSKGFQDVSHGNAVVSTTIDIYENNLGLNDRYIKALVNTMNHVIWSEEKGSLLIDGTGKGSSWFSDGFIKLGRYDDSLQTQFENHKKGRSIQFLAHLTFNHVIATQIAK